MTLKAETKKVEKKLEGGVLVITYNYNYIRQSDCWRKRKRVEARRKDISMCVASAPFYLETARYVFAIT